MKKLSLILILVGMLYATEVKITSDKMQADENIKIIDFIGHAHVVQEDSILDADKIKVYFDDQNQTKKYDAIGNVKFDVKSSNAHYKGYSQKLTYLPKKSLYILVGNANIDDLLNKRTIAGEKIILNMISGNAVVNGTKQKPVKVIFQMENKK